MNETKYEHRQIYRDREYKGQGCLGELTLGLFTKATYTFWFYADAVSPVKGKYIASKSQTVVIKAYDDGPDSWSTFGDDKRIRDTHDSFVNHLVQEGWEPLSERGEYWWHLRFRRRIE